MSSWAAAGIWLAALVAANLLITALGAAAAPFVAFVLIGLDLTLRDRLHDAWQGRQLPLRMGLLIGAGAGLSWAINPAAGWVGVASAVAFAAAAGVDGLVYAGLRDRPWTVRANVSNVAGAIVDSVLFLGLIGAMGPLVLVQIAAKVAGGAVWAALLGRRRDELEAAA